MFGHSLECVDEGISEDHYDEQSEADLKHCSEPCTGPPCIRCAVAASTSHIPVTANKLEAPFVRITLRAHRDIHRRRCILPHPIPW